MLEKKINLDEIINICINKDYESKYNNICKDSMLEFGKQLLELACENAKIQLDNWHNEEDIREIHEIYDSDDDKNTLKIYNQSILKTIEQVK